MTMTSFYSESLLILFIFMDSQSEGLKVDGPKAPLVAVAGEDLILPCFIQPNTSAVDMTVEWFKLHVQDSLVHLYREHEDRNENQAHSYRGRTSVFKEELQKGNASLKLSALQTSDEGQYKCLIEDKSWSDEITVHIIVEVLGSHPVITMESYDNSGGINLMCESRDWKPEPDVLWLDREKVTLPAEDTQIHKDTESFSVKRRITVYDYSDSNRYYCRLKQRHHIMETEVIINSNIFGVWKWAVGISVSAFLVAVGLILILIIYYEKALQMEKKNAELQMEKETAALELQKKMEKAEFIKKTLFAVDVTLDPDTAHSLLILTPDNKEVKCGSETQQGLPNSPNRFAYACVLGKQSFSSGRFYYEVQVKNKSEWTLGVVSKNINRVTYTLHKPQTGFWTLGLRSGNQYEAHDENNVCLTLKEKMEKVGVFVDHEKGLVSFYNVDASSCIHSFTGQTFESVELYPYFSPRYNERGDNADPLIITPVSDVISASYAMTF